MGIAEAAEWAAGWLGLLAVLGLIEARLHRYRVWDEEELS